MSQENLETVQRTMDAYNARDLTTYLAALSESVRFQSRFSAIDNVIYNGHVGMRRYFANLDEVWSRYEMQIESMVPAGVQVAVLCHLYAVGRDSDLHLEEYPGVVFTVESWTIVQIDSYPTHTEARVALGVQG
jgi:ketosteroid isomerase-like protein